MLLSCWSYQEVGWAYIWHESNNFCSTDIFSNRSRSDLIQISIGSHLDLDCISLRFGWDLVRKRWRIGTLLFHFPLQGLKALSPNVLQRSDEVQRVVASEGREQRNFHCSTFASGRGQTLIFKHLPFMYAQLKRSQGAQGESKPIFGCRMRHEDAFFRETRCQIVSLTLFLILRPWGVSEAVIKSRLFPPPPPICRKQLLIVLWRKRDRQMAFSP